MVKIELFCADENVTRDIRRNLMDWQVPWDGEHVSEHEPSTQTEEGSDLANGSTSATMMDMRQQFLSVPPMVWNGLVVSDFTSVL